MRYRRLLPVLIICCLLLSACSGGDIAGILEKNGITSSAACKVELRYLQQSRGDNYMLADMSGNAGFLAGLLEGIEAAKPADKPQVAQYTPELKSYCEIVLTAESHGALSLYYDSELDLLVYPNRRQNGDKTALNYLYFTPGEGLEALLQAQEPNAKLMETTAVKPFRNIEELKSSIDDDELMDPTTDIEWEFFSDATPEYTGTACRVYTPAQFAGVPEGCYLITCYGKTKTGEQMKLSVLGMEVNAYYTKVIITEPDEALESVDTGEDTPDSYAVTVKTDAIDPAKWIVFVDSDDVVYDVIVPEDIDGMLTAGPQDTAAPARTVDPYEGGGD